MQVLTQPRNALSKQYETMFEMSAVGLHLTRAATRAIARSAIDRGTGARGLRSIMEGLLQPVMFEVGPLLSRSGGVLHKYNSLGCRVEVSSCWVLADVLAAGLLGAAQCCGCQQRI